MTDPVKRLHDHLLAMWDAAEYEGDETTVRATKRFLDIFGLPWVRS